MIGGLSDCSFILLVGLYGSAQYPLQKRVHSQLTCGLQ
jgi:hypothetical protein